ncbi:uncharacterized protein LOC113759763 [Coffea eugenioides]|uniref:uncharacterized protein LOC113759763 n=1 Tax=Coffea eugenioides TaxID=49369 RepID=UPI000F60C3F2|nr:uncharacterized protein LOC113759763 [Coffea eugenioides]
MCGVPIPRSISSTLIVLLPKVDASRTFSDFRPISLCTFVNKVFTKILSNRLKSVMPLLISPEQSAFAQSKEISDNVLIAQDMVAGLDRRTRGHNIIFKLDKIKAFDHVSWEFLSRLLLRLGFPSHFVALVLNNLCSAWFSVLINGKPHGFFQAGRGIKQGDSLSPFLFILVSEALSRGLGSLLAEGKLKAYAQPQSTVPISHLAFADDIVIFTTADRRTVRHLIDFLEVYQRGSGIEALNNQTNGLPPEPASLGCCLYKGRTKREYFQPLVDKDATQVCGLEEQDALSGGPLNLDQTCSSCNTAIHLYSSGALQNDSKPDSSDYGSFFLGGGRWARQAALEELECTLPTHRTQWPRSLTARGRLLCFWVQTMVEAAKWRHALDPLWSTAVTHPFGSITGPLGHGKQALHLPAISIAELRAKRQWRLDRVGVALTSEERRRVLASTLLPSHRADRVVWQLSTVSVFKVASALERLQSPSNPLISCKLIWNQRIPLKISIFMWRLLNNLLPFPDILRQFGFHLPSKCPFCPSEDMLTHCFVDCQTACQVWCWFEHALHLNAGAADSLFLKLQGWWMHSSGKTLFATFAHLLLVFICWELWKARTKAVFENMVSSPEQACRRIVTLVNLIGEAHPWPYSAPHDPIFCRLGVKVVATQLQRCTCVSLSWSFPPYPYAKLNVDGSSFGNPGFAGGGGILRDHIGRVLRAFSTFYGPRTNMESEAMALLEGLRLSMSLGLPKLIVHMDSKQVLQMVQ